MLYLYIKQIFDINYLSKYQVPVFCLYEKITLLMYKYIDDTIKISKYKLQSAIFIQKNPYFKQNIWSSSIIFYSFVLVIFSLIINEISKCY